jgi:hypothetical protein
LERLWEGYSWNGEAETLRFAARLKNKKCYTNCEDALEQNHGWCTEAAEKKQKRKTIVGLAQVYSIQGRRPVP